jgi:hypothetical protein
VNPLIWLSLGGVGLLLLSSRAKASTPSSAPTSAGLGKAKARERFIQLLLDQGQAVHVVDAATSGELVNSPGFYLVRTSVGPDAVYKAVLRGSEGSVATGIYVLNFDQQQTNLLNYLATG